MQNLRLSSQNLAIAFGDEGSEGNRLFFAVESEVGDPKVWMSRCLGEEFAVFERRPPEFATRGNRALSGKEFFYAERSLR